MRKKYFAVILLLIFTVSFSSSSYADIIKMINAREVKGVILKELKDEVIINTIDGEIKIPRRNITSILYSEQEQYYFQLGNKLREQGKIKEASIAYQNALKIRPDFSQAQAALFSLRLHMWKDRDQALKEHLEQLNRIYRYAEDSNMTAKEKAITAQTYTEEKIYQQCGFLLEEVSGIIRVKDIRPGSPAELAGVRQNDVIVSLGGEPIQDLAYHYVLGLFILNISEIHISVFRNVNLVSEKKSLFDYIPFVYFYWGLSTDLFYEGLTISKIRKGSAADIAGLKTADIIVSVNSEPVQFIPERKVYKLMMENRAKVEIGINRSVAFWKELQ